MYRIYSESLPKDASRGDEETPRSSSTGRPKPDLEGFFVLEDHNNKKKAHQATTTTTPATSVSSSSSSSSSSQNFGLEGRCVDDEANNTKKKEVEDEDELNNTSHSIMATTSDYGGDVDDEPVGEVATVVGIKDESLVEIAWKPALDDSAQERQRERDRLEESYTCPEEIFAGSSNSNSNSPAAETESKPTRSRQVPIRSRTTDERVPSAPKKTTGGVMAAVKPPPTRTRTLPGRSKTTDERVVTRSKSLGNSEGSSNVTTTTTTPKEPTTSNKRVPRLSATSNTISNKKDALPSLRGMRRTSKTLADVANEQGGSNTSNNSSGTDGSNNGVEGSTNRMRRSIRRNRTTDDRLGNDNDNNVSGTAVAVATPPPQRSIRRNRTVDERLGDHTTGSLRKARTTGDTTSTGNNNETTTASNNRRGSLRRTRTVDERVPNKANRTPTRSSSSGAQFIKSVMLPKRTSSGSSRRHRRSSMTPITHFNIFGSELMVTTEFILNQLDKVMEEKDVVTLELEDCLGRNSNNSEEQHAPDEIPLQLRHILHDERPWEGLHFVDDLRLSVATNNSNSLEAQIGYKDFKYCKKRFLKHLGGVCQERVIPVHYHLKVTLEDETTEDAPTTNTNTTVTATDGNNNNIMISLLRDFQSDPSILTLTVQTQFATVELLEALTALLQCDTRSWQTVTLQLSSISNPGTREWQQAMQAATEELQQVAVSRGIKMM